MEVLCQLLQWILDQAPNDWRAEPPNAADIYLSHGVWLLKDLATTECSSQ